MDDADAAVIAAERGIPANWLNTSARPWMPPLPKGVLVRPKQPGLRVTYAGRQLPVRYQARCAAREGRG
jgi:hypothetical protein